MTTISRSAINNSPEWTCYLTFKQGESYDSCCYDGQSYCAKDYFFANSDGNSLRAGAFYGKHDNHAAAACKTFYPQPSAGDTFTGVLVLAMGICGSSDGSSNACHIQNNM